MIKWLNLRQVTDECGFRDTRTFLNNYAATYPPDRTNGKRKWWTDSTVKKIKQDIFGSTHEKEA